MVVSAVAAGHQDVKTDPEAIEQLPPMVVEKANPDECPNMFEFFNVINGAPDGERAIDFFQLYAAMYEPERVMTIADVREARAEIATNGLGAWKDNALLGIIDELHFHKCIVD